ncbi:MAG: GNAT family N-acetyltransferase [Cyanobacteria bacterium]|nr:GNAT family N-acetyltransferase [Cyanobacteriota bacterium]
MASLGIADYQLRRGNGRDRPLLEAFMARTLWELGAGLSDGHIAAMVEAHLSPATPVWWVADASSDRPIACLWLGNAQDQRQGDRHAYVMLLYVDPDHRRRGIATALLRVAETWARRRGDRQIGLQVFPDNEAALALYERRGYTPAALWLNKPLQNNP